MNWYRTIDRITPSLRKKAKLLIPDIQGDVHIVYEKGFFYPNHNLYYITSEEWNLRALHAVLLSEITKLSVSRRNLSGVFVCRTGSSSRRRYAKP